MDTLGTIRTEVLAWLDEATNTTETYTNTTNAINMAHQQRCTESAWTFMLWRQPETFTIVPGQRRYVLHQLLSRPLYFKNRTTDRFLRETPWRQMEANAVQWLTNTSGDRYVFVEPSPLQVQPSANSVLTIVSTSAADTTAALGVTITGMVGGTLVSETITPTGVTPANSTVTFDATSIIAVSKTAAWTGTCTITNATSVTLLTLRPTELSRSFPQIELLWTPGDADVIEYRFYRKPRVLSNANDVPDLPEPFGRLLVWDALVLMATYDGDMTPARLSGWMEQRDKLLQQLSTTYLEAGSTMASEPRFVHTDEDIYSEFE